VTRTTIGKLTGFLLIVAALLAAGIDGAEAAQLDAPRIYLVAPSSDAAVDSPANVTLRFEASRGSDIDLASFQVLYRSGLFTKDITEQILKFVSLTPRGLTGSTPPRLRPGVHILVIRIRDTRHRLGELTLSLRIAR
jgi:hypothetical protein